LANTSSAQESLRGCTMHVIIFYICFIITILSNELEKKTVIFSYAMVNLGILKINFNCFVTYKNTSTGFIGGSNTSSAQESLRGCTMHVIIFYICFIITIFIHLSFITSFKMYIATVRSNYITVKVILLSWLFGRNTCKVFPWRYNKTRIN
jgi:hypothetical protein